MDASAQEVVDTVEQDQEPTEAQESPETGAAAESESAEGAAETSAAETPPDAPAGEEAESSQSDGAVETAEPDTGGAESPSAEGGDSEGKTVQRAQFQPLTAKGFTGQADNMHLLLDVAVPVTVELGSADMCIREILDLGPGSVVKLDRPVGEPVDILVNGERVGKGEVVVVDDQFGVRVTALLRPNLGTEG